MARPTSAKAEPTRRQRMDPADRAEQILNETARLVIEEGLSAVTMDRIGRACGISKALVYNYFGNRDILLAALLQREQADLRDRGLQTSLRAKTYADLIRQTTRLYLEQMQDRGALIQTLLADPSVACLMEDENRREYERTLKYFVRETRRAYSLPAAMAAASVDMLMAVTNQAGRLVSTGALDLQTAEDMCVHLITDGLAKLTEKMNLS